MEEDRKIRKPSKSELYTRIIALEERVQKTETLLQATFGEDVDKSMMDDIGAFWSETVVGSNKRKRNDDPAPPPPPPPVHQETPPEDSDKRIVECVDSFLGSSDSGYVLRAKKALYVQVLKLVIYFLGHAVSTIKLGVYGHEIVMALKPQ
ncbi:hypothetical protein [Medusavirus stheno T3]|uniref:Uncharacterized protein n=1 Tax=Medusavirus stheno T3 TaxID=3069717 RepID=A0A7S7YF73_9VIRU|nr:hypothetical protein QKU73_gp405 [Acanthamoeba castellanii medusavirus]QPB44370.1 hypothetical protein [Medusavirus stheno T3]